MTKAMVWARKRPGFTLIELLVVISIIAMLVSILLPALANARKAAQNTKCLALIRQITIASINYSVDHKSNLPARYVPSSDWGIHQYAAYTGNLETYYTTISPGGRYTSTKPNPAWSCPTSGVRSGAAVDANNIKYITTYVPNVALATGNGNLSGRAVNFFNDRLTYESRHPTLDQIVSHSRTIVYGEANGRFVGNGGAMYGYIIPGFTTFHKSAGENAGVIASPTQYNTYLINAPVSSTGWYGMTQSAGYWHNTGLGPRIGSSNTLEYSPSATGNFAWADGHATAIKPTDGRDVWLVAGAHPFKIAQ